MGDNSWLYLLLIAVVLLFGVGVLLRGRRQTNEVGGARQTTERSSSPSVGDVSENETDEPSVDSEDVTSTSTESATTDEVAPGGDLVPEVEQISPPNLRSRLGKARAALSGALGAVVGRSGISDDTWDELEEALLLADVGFAVTQQLLEPLRACVEAREIETPHALVNALRESMASQLLGADRQLHLRTEGHPSIWLIVGVNGVGKTTTVGKLAAQQVAGGCSVLLAAGDTFRAAAAEQLAMWAERSGADIVRGADGADPSSVVFDAVERATARNVTLVLADTAGRLHNKQNLMDELSKVRRVAEKGAGVVTETLLVIDATTGQNGLVQAREFAAATGVTGIVVTKLDGSAKGGIVFAVETELGIPVKCVGVGEGIADLTPFDPQEFVEALVGE